MSILNDMLPNTTFIANLYTSCRQYLYITLSFCVFSADSEALFEAYDKILNKYVKTQLTKTCAQKLKQTGVLVLSGVQGSGKTLTAIHIMNSRDYNGWTKLKFTSCDDLLAFDIKEKTVIIIDNIFDGYLYSYPLHRWWHSLCYFYFEHVRKRNDICLIITAKEDVIEKASAHLKANFQLFHVKTESFPLTYKEKLSILTKHIELAKEEKDVPSPFLSTSLIGCIRNHTGPIGFPLCAYLYAFEDRNAVKDDCIFKDTVAYVRKQIAHTIETDNTYRVKTLLLILLFYQSPPGSNYVLDLKYREDCYEFLQQDCFKEWVEKIKPLQTENLHEKAKELERTLFLKHLTLHEVYLNGVRDYFMRTHWEVAVPHFPLDILRTDEFKNMSVECSKKLMERFKNEILQNIISKTLSSKIFEDPSFERKFCQKLHEENILKNILLVPDKSSEYKLPAIFWANKYHLKILSKKLWDVAEKNEHFDHFQFYLARFGECCENDENFITSTPSTLDVTNLKEVVRHFRTPGKETILHLIVSSEKSDYDAYCFLKTILQDIPELTTTVDTNLFKYALIHSKRSRLLCTLEIIHRLNFRSDIGMIEEIPCVIDRTNEAFWELEWIVRICVVWTYNEEQSGTKRIAFYPTAKDQRHLQELLDRSTLKQKDMVRILKACIEEREKSTPSSSGDIFKIDDIPFKEGLSSELKNFLLESIQEQLKKDDCF